jgi:hypothetical protein
MLNSRIAKPGADFGILLSKFVLQIADPQAKEGVGIAEGKGKKHSLCVSSLDTVWLSAP